MEVHHRSHTERKKWTHYFWEFVMLFFAVTLGFFTENIRERFQERHRINEFMCKIFFDLQSDITTIKKLKQERMIRNRQCDSLINQLMQSPNTADKNKTYYYGRNATRRIHFRPQDATLQQLKSTGYLRLVEDPDVLNAMNQYQQLLKYNDENVLVEEKELSEISQLTARIFNASVFQQMLSNGQLSMPSNDPPLLTYDKILLNELSNKLHYWKRTSLSVLESFDELETDAEELLKQIKENYNCPEKKK
jgi:hypothetical protein